MEIERRTNWTPGPWEADSTEILVGDGENIKVVASAYGYPSFTDEVRKANANLIAAAPELYDTLAGLVSILELLRPAMTRAFFETFTDPNVSFTLGGLLHKADQVLDLAEGFKPAS